MMSGRTRLNAYQANKSFDGPSPFNAGPGWCFDRFGQSETQLPDGRALFIAGEHEDFYDPDFYIYNDVVVVGKSGEISIFGYPADIFPPTDFHLATLVGNDLILIGNLGYPQDRKPRQTQVLRLELDTWRLSSVENFGECPGWINRHNAHLSATNNEILISGGQIDRGDETSLTENIDEWSLDLQTWHWKRLTRRQWYRFEVHRKDQKWNHLWKLRSLSWRRKSIETSEEKELYKTLENEWKRELGLFDKIWTMFFPRRFVSDLNLLETLYAPEIATEIIAENILEDDDDEFNVYRIRIGDVIVRYVEDSYCINVTIEGELPQEIVEQLKKDLMEKFAVLERTRISCRTVPFE